MNPGQPAMAPMQMHGVSGPNGPVSQAGPMMAMQMPAQQAHALSHLQPQAAQIFQQQQQQHMQSEYIHRFPLETI
jgi:hypothetical protein